MQVLNNKIGKVSVRQIALKAKIDQRTVSKFLKGERVNLQKEIQIKIALSEIIKEIDTVEKQLM